MSEHTVKDAQGNEYTLSGDAKICCEQCHEETDMTVDEHHAMPAPRPAVYCKACRPYQIN